jgi:hypothetical protein
MPTEAEPARVRSTVPYSATRELIDQLWKFANRLFRDSASVGWAKTPSRRAGYARLPIIA